MTRMFWRRCPRCGRLALSRIGMETTCECAPGAPTSAPLPPAASTPESAGAPPVLPMSAWAPAIPPNTTAAPAPAPSLLTPEQDAAARRLLASVFPSGFDF